MTKLRKPRMTCPHCGSVYALEREGDPLARGDGDEPPATAPFHSMTPRTHDWYAFFFRLRAKPQERPWRATALGGETRIVHRAALLMLQAARTGGAHQCDAAERPTEGERDAMTSVKVGSPEFDAWRRKLAEEGYSGFGADGAEWVRVPSTWPPGRAPGGVEDEIMMR